MNEKCQSHSLIVNIISIQLFVCYHEWWFLRVISTKLFCAPLSLYPIIMPGSRSPYCHGRCVFGGRKCFFHPCSPSPYRTSSAETCTKIAFEIEDDQCQRACHYHGHLKCQECIQENLPDQCSELSGATINHWLSKYHFMLLIRVFLLVLQLPNIARVCPVPNCSPRPIRSHRLHQVQADSPWLHLLHLYPPLLLGAGRSSV